MQNITIKIETINDAFKIDGGSCAYEVARILDKLSKKMKQNGYIDDCKIRDTNGNTVGELKTN